MMTGTRMMEGMNHTTMDTESTPSSRGAPNTVKAVTVAMQHPSIPPKCSNHQCMRRLGGRSQYAS